MFVVIEASLFDFVTNMVSLGGYFVHKFDHGGPCTLMHRINETRTRHLHVLFAYLVVPQVDEELVGELVVEFEHVVERVVDYFFVVFEYVA